MLTEKSAQKLSTRTFSKFYFSACIASFELFQLNFYWVTLPPFGCHFFSLLNLEQTELSLEVFEKVCFFKWPQWPKVNLSLSETLSDFKHRALLKLKTDLS